MQDDRRPGMSRDAQAELRVKTVLEEAAAGHLPGPTEEDLVSYFKGLTAQLQDST